MSRSRKKSPVATVGCKGYREILNRKFRRRKGEDTVNKKNEGYLVRDGRWFMSIYRDDPEYVAKIRRK